MFGALALYGSTTKRSLAGVGQFVFMGLIGVVLASVVGMFWHSPGLQFAISIVGVIVFTGLTAWDAQRLKAMACAAAGGAGTAPTPSSERSRCTSTSSTCSSSCCASWAAGETEARRRGGRFRPAAAVPRRAARARSYSPGRVPTSGRRPTAPASAGRDRDLLVLVELGRLARVPEQVGLQAVLPVVEVGVAPAARRAALRGGRARRSGRPRRPGSCRRGGWSRGGAR